MDIVELFEKARGFYIGFGTKTYCPMVSGYDEWGTEIPAALGAGDGVCAVCLQGALEVVAGESYGLLELGIDLLDEAADLELGADLRSSRSRESPSLFWHDHPDTTRNEALAVYDCAISLAKDAQ